MYPFTYPLIESCSCFHPNQCSFRNHIQKHNKSFVYYFQEGVTDPPSVSSISRLLRGGGGHNGGTGGGGSDRKYDDGRKDYSIHGILGGKFSQTFLFINIFKYLHTQVLEFGNFLS